VNDGQRESLMFIWGFVAGVGVSLIITLVFRGVPV